MFIYLFICFYFETVNSKEPIEGPKTLEETIEEEVIAQRVEIYLKGYHKIEIAPEKKVSWNQWVPRLEEIEPDPETQTTVTAIIEELGETFSWRLRKGLEWADFKFLTNLKIGHSEWEAHMGKAIWDGEACNG
jgi:hypothetical protein